MLTYLRCSAGGNEGWGNLFRILIIRKYLIKKFKSKIILIIQANQKVKEFLTKEKINFLYLKKGNFNFEKKKIDSLNRSDLTIIEMLNPNLKLQNLYMQKSEKVIILDDVLENKYKIDLLISCQNTSKKPLVSKKTIFHSGYKFFPFKEEFNKFLKKKKSVKKHIENITVFLGGSSYEDINYKIAKLLKKRNRTRFILGGELNVEFKRKLLQINKKFIISKLPKNLAEILFNSDLVISGGGYTKIEVASVGTPQISIPIHKHQLDLLKNFKKKFKTQYIYKNKINTLDKKIENFNFKKRNLESNIYKKYFIQNGLKNIFEKIKEI